MFQKHAFWLLPLFSFLFLEPLPACAAETASPDALVKSVTEEVMSILRTDTGIQSGNRQKAVALIEDKVAPHFDFARMTSLAVGQSWQKTDASQREAMTSEFRTLPVRTYATALTEYRDQTVTFKPAGQPGSNGEVTIRSQIKKPGSQPIPLDYSLSKSDKGCQVFDITISGVSLVTNYRSSFAVELEKGGLPGLLKTLPEKNRRLQATASPAAS